MHSLKKKKSALVNSLPIQEPSEGFDFAKEMVRIQGNQHVSYDVA